MKLKNLYALILLVALLISAVGCGATQDGEDVITPVLEGTTTPPETSERTTECAHSYTETVEKEPTPLLDGEKKLACALCGDSRLESIPATKKISILAIGNSFSVDAMEYLWNILKDGGVNTVVLGNMYIGGCTLQTHYSNMRIDGKSYTYYKNTSGAWSTRKNVSISEALKEEEWDIITVQQASGSSGVESSYSMLPDVISYLEANKPNAKLLWHMTWAYQQNSTHSSFPTYGKDQTTMYNAIVSSVNAKVLTQKKIMGVIPSGTAIQNLRSSYVGDTVTRDGYHLSYDFGRYTAALTWFSYLTGVSPDVVNWIPSNYAYSLEGNKEVIRESVANAIKSPYKVTRSTLKDPNPDTEIEKTDGELIASLGVNIDNYEKLDWLLEVNAYYNSNHGTNLFSKATSTASNLPNFIASKMFTKETLPVGSIIIVDSGYQYRPERWVNENYVGTSSTRPGNSSARVTMVTESWWNGYGLRAFNLSAIATRKMTDADVEHMRIYIPKNS